MLNLAGFLSTETYQIICSFFIKIFLTLNSSKKICALEDFILSLCLEILSSPSEKEVYLLNEIQHIKFEFFSPRFLTSLTFLFTKIKMVAI